LHHWCYIVSVVSISEDQDEGRACRVVHAAAVG